MFGRYSERAQRVIILAQDEARRLNYNYTGTEHLLLGLLREHQGIAARALHNLGLDLDLLRAEIERTLGRGTAPASGEMAFTPRGKKVIMELAIDEARRLGHSYVGTEHLLLGLLREGQCAAARMLDNMGADIERTRSEITNLLGRPIQRAPQGPGAEGDTGREASAPRRPEALPTARRQVALLVHHAEAEARRLGGPGVTTEHLLLAMAADGEGVPAKVLRAFGVDLPRVRTEVEQALAGAEGAAADPNLLTPAAHRVLVELAPDEARHMGLSSADMGPEHVLLGLLRDAECPAGRVLAQLGVDLERARVEVRHMTSVRQPAQPSTHTRPVATAQLTPRTAPLLHASAAVVDGSGRVLLARARPDDARWVLPGGSPRDGEPLRQAAERGTREITGLEVRCGRLLWTLETIGGPEGAVRSLHLVYLGEVAGGEPGPAAAYFSREDVPAEASLPPGFWEAVAAGFSGHDPGVSRRVPDPEG